MTNWAQVLADDLSITIDDVAIYSNVDPAREWTGAASIEINVNAVNRVALISGGAFLDYQVVVACRALTFDAADDLATTLKEKVETLIDSYIANLSIIDGVITSQEVAPDIRGINEGESFYGLLNVTLTEKEGY